jgi:hypothetical protein
MKVEYPGTEDIRRDVKPTWVSWRSSCISRAEKQALSRIGTFDYLQVSSPVECPTFLQDIKLPLRQGRKQMVQEFLAKPALR